MPEMAARTLRLCLPLQKIPREARLLQEARVENDCFSKSYDFLINPYGSREDKSLSIEKTKSLIRHLATYHRDSSFGVMHSPNSLLSASQLVDDLSLPNVELVKGITNFESVIPIIRKSGLLISVALLHKPCPPNC